MKENVVVIDGIMLDAIIKENKALRHKVEYMNQWEDKALDLIGKLFTENAHLIQELEKIKEVFK